MAKRRRGTYGPIIRPAIVMIAALVAALIIGQGPWLPIALVVAVLAATFVVLAVIQNIPGKRK
ncbi:hypothetical protein B7R54_19270 [Subtercola boreus]|uniref:Uncharacterized protein n=1 Tax=Subtercola boreus TaxID=120213 RepID=A0A3E0VAK7_9MICO|nr:hypothetical protein B7R54_19270 [Subtercola boreus]TQL46805.1 hypothetical protein FB464_3797 [Subtercola boreus]